MKVAKQVWSALVMAVAFTIVCVMQKTGLILTAISGAITATGGEDDALQAAIALAEQPRGTAGDVVSQALDAKVAAAAVRVRPATGVVQVFNSGGDYAKAKGFTFSPDPDQAGAWVVATGAAADDSFASEAEIALANAVQALVNNVKPTRTTKALVNKLIDAAADAGVAVEIFVDQAGDGSVTIKTSAAAVIDDDVPGDVQAAFLITPITSAAGLPLE